MTEIVVLRVIAVASLIWFMLSEWRHHNQLAAAFTAGVKSAEKTMLKHTQMEIDDFIKEFRTELTVLVEAIKKDDDVQPADEARTSETRAAKKEE
jgi:hypothetical protein